VTVQIAHDVLAAAGGVTALVSDRISPVEHRDYTFPCVVLTLISTAPVNALDGWCGLDYCTVQIDAWATSYLAASDLATACRTAMEAAGHLMLSSVSDEFSPFINLDGAYRVANQFSIWA
jgi:hypothetical protein